MRASFSRFIFSIAIVVIGVAPLLTTSLHASAASSTKFGTLRVIVTGLEKGAVPNLILTGPYYRRTLHEKSTSIRLRPGSYEVRSLKVVEPNGVESPGPASKVEVEVGKRSTVSGAYYFVPKTTVSVTPQQTVSISGSNSGAQVLTLSGMLSAPSPGEILASGPVAARPDGYLVKVTSAIIHGTEVTADVVPATLAQAVPDGSLNLEQVFSELTSALSSKVRSSSRKLREPPVLNRSFASSELSCSGDGAISVTSSLGFTFDGANASMEWHWLDSAASVSINYSVSAMLDISATAAAECSADVSLLAGTAGSFVVDAGVPVVLTPTYSVSLDGEASGGGSYNETLGDTLGVSMTGGIPPSFSSTVDSQPVSLQPGTDSDATVKLSIDAKIGIEVDGLAGVSIDAGPALNFAYDPSSSPAWSLQGCIYGGFTANILGHTVVDQSKSLSWCKMLAQSTSSASNGSPTQPSQISTDNITSCVIKAGRVFCWGGGSDGELGDGAYDNSSVPVAVNGITNATAISVGSDNVCALLSTKTISCWGYNGTGDLGDGSTENSNIPMTVPGISNAVGVSTGGGTTCALIDGGTVDCWGNNDFGALGIGSTTNSTVPIPVPGLTDVEQISIGDDEDCALLTTGHVDCWGYNQDGQLGNGTTSNSLVPVAVSNISDATQISSGWTFACADLKNKSVECWGDNSDSELGLNDEPDSLIPISVPGISATEDISAGGYSACVAMGSGSAECWGDNEFGELGNGTISTSFPSPVLNLSGISEISAGPGDSCALLSDGGVDCWGDNQWGELGNGDTTNSVLPVKVSGF